MIAAQQVRRPLIGIALSIAAGIGFHHGMGGSPLLWLGIGALLLAVICHLLGRRNSELPMYIACGLLAAAYSAIEAIPSDSRSVLPLAEVTREEQHLTGVIKGEPAASGTDGTVSFLFRTETVFYNGARHPSDATIMVYIKDPDLTVRFGEKWRLCGRYTGYEKPRAATAGFFSVSSGGAVRLQAARPSLTRSCYNARKKAADILRFGITEFSGPIKLLHALLLGYRQAMPDELYRLFSRTGVLHIFAISGLHVGVMAAILIAGLKTAGVPRPQWGWLLIPSLFLYVLATGMKASALRAFTMAAVYFAAPLAGRRPDAPSSVALAGTLLLLLNPANITDPGFLLSFIVVCGILMVHGWVSRTMSGLRFAGWDHRLRQLGGPHPAAALLRATSLLMLTSFSAWIFSAPITAHFFNTLSPAALIGNLAVIPLTFMIMLTGCLAVVCGSLFLPAVALLNQANLLFINLLIWAVTRLASLPGACRTVCSPSAFAAGLWYAGLVLFFTGPVRWRKGAIAAVVLAGLLWAGEARPPDGSINILREGDSALALRLPEKNRWVLATDGNPFKTVRTTRLLQKEGVNRLYALLVTGEQADPQAIRQFQEIFHPQQTIDEAETGGSLDGGTVRIITGR